MTVGQQQLDSFHVLNHSPNELVNHAFSVTIPQWGHPSKFGTVALPCNYNQPIRVSVVYEPGGQKFATVIGTKAFH